MVAHTFSCPQGLFFNQITDGCDFLRNVECGDKDTEEPEPVKKDPVKSAEPSSPIVDSEEDEDDVEDPKSLKDILEIVKAAGLWLNMNQSFIEYFLRYDTSSNPINFSLGGIEGLEQQIKEEEDAKKEQEDRIVRISSKTRSRLSQLLNKGQRTKSEK